LSLCVAGLTLRVRRPRWRSGLAYRLDGTRLEVRDGRASSYVLLGDLTRIATDASIDVAVIPSLPRARSDLGGRRSARDYANRAAGIVWLEAGGEWLRLSPTDPYNFLAVLDAQITAIRHRENT